MTVSIKAEREKLRPLAARIKEMARVINAENRDFNTEEKVEWDRVNAAYDAASRRIDIMERSDEITSTLAQPAGMLDVGRSAFRGSHGAAVTDEHRTKAMMAWMQYQAGLDPSEDLEESAKLCGVKLRNREFVINRAPRISYNQVPLWATKGGVDYRAALEYRATMSGHSGPAGGYLTSPGSLINSLEVALLQFGGLRAVADVMTTTTGEPMAWPTGNDTTNKGRLIGENAEATTTTTPSPTFGATIFGAYEYTSDFILLPFTLLQDALANLPQILGAMLGERLGRIQAEHFATGHGGGMPTGLLFDAVLGVTTASATAIAADELLDLVHTIDPAYRSMPGVGWAFHDLTLKHIRKLKDGNGRYLWQEGMSSGEPNTIWDYPYTIVQEMDTIVASAKTVLFGVLNKFKIRDVGQVILRRADELFLRNHQVGFVAYSRHDSKLIDAGTHPVKSMQQHS